MRTYGYVIELEDRALGKDFEETRAERRTGCDEVAEDEYSVGVDGLDTIL